MKQKWLLGTLFFCVFLAWFTEVLLSPFYPQFFRKVFGVEDLSYTGYYIFICRLTVVIASPLWGIIARWISVKYLIYFGQLGSAIMTAMMATATNENQFLWYTVVLLVLKSSYFLVYTLIIQLAGESQRSTVAGTYQAVSHGAIITSTIAGAWMMGWEAPLSLFYGVAIADLIQLALCVYFLRGVETKPHKEPIAQETKLTTGKQQIGFILAIGMAILTFQLANNLIRPYFTEYVIAPEPFNISLLNSSILFLIPSVMAIAALPYIHVACKPHNLKQIYTFGMVLLVASLFLQGWTSSLLFLVFSRLVYGFFLAVTETVLQLKLFNESSENGIHFNYSVAASFANVGRLGAPLAASWLVSNYNLAAPFLAAAIFSIANWLFAKFTIFQNTPKPKTSPPIPQE